MPGSSFRKTTIWTLLLVIGLNSAGQILFKAVRAAHPDATVLLLFLDFKIWAAFIIYGLSALCWLWVLSRAQLSFVYPMLSLTFPIVVGLSAVLFSESILPMHWAGVGVIVFGVSLLART